MADRIPVQEISARVDRLRKEAQDLYDLSSDFPALNRNLKRILASLEMLRINVEEVGE